MLAWFRENKYDHEGRPVVTRNVNASGVMEGRAEENGLVDDEMMQVLNDVEELFGEPVFLTF